MKEAFSNFLCSPVKSVAQVKDVVASPAGTAIIMLLLTTLLMTSIAGFAVYGADQGTGPLADIVGSTNEELWEEVHEFFANFTPLLVFLHIAGVAMLSWLRCISST